jgi:hypothetical protein
MDIKSPKITLPGIKIKIFLETKRTNEEMKHLQMIATRDSESM